MPVTAKLSRAFYEKLGDALTSELVEWFNQVDATYRSDLRELNERNFARFDAKVEQRFAQQDAKWDRFAEFDAKLEHRVTELDAKLERQFMELERSLTQLRMDLEVGLKSVEVKLIRWMFLFWIGQAATTAGLAFGIVRLTAK